MLKSVKPVPGVTVPGTGSQIAVDSGVCFLGSTWAIPATVTETAENNYGSFLTLFKTWLACYFI